MLKRAGAALLYGAMIGAASLGAAAADDLVIRAPSYSPPAPPVEAGVRSMAPAPEPRAWRLIDSRWGYVAPMNIAVASTLELCPDYDAEKTASLRLSPNRFTAITTAAIVELQACRPDLFGPDAPPGAIDARAWKALLPGAPLPGVLDKTKVIAFGASALTPDYDRAAWNLDRPDREAVLTWGPFRATAGGGCTLQKLLAELAADPATAPALTEAFAGEEALLAALLDRSRPDWCASAPALLQPVFDDAERRDAFPIRFAQLAGEAAVRAAYDRYFLGPKGYLSARMAQYYGLYRRAGLKPTEADFAFFLDHALGYPPFTPELTGQLDKALRKRGLKTWEARRLIANTLPYRQPGSRAFALGRDAAFFVDGAGEDGLTEEERAAWLAHSRTRASDVGLADRPYRPGCDVLWLDECGKRGPL